VSIAFSSRASWGPGDAWTVDQAPIFRIGQTGGSGSDDELGTVLAAFVLPDSVVVVIDDSQQLRYFTWSGRMLGRYGRAGDGPGEFRGILRVHRMKHDTLLVSDFGSQVTVVADTGAYARTFRLETAYYAYHVFDDGSMLANPTSANPQYRAGRGAAAGAGAPVDSAVFGLWSQDGRYLRPFGQFAAVQRNLIFGASGLMAAAKSTFFHMFSNRPEVSEYDIQGRLKTILRLRLRATPVSDADRHAYLEAKLNAISSESPAVMDAVGPRLRAQVSDPNGAAEFFPFFSGLIVSRDGYLWLREYEREDGYSSGRLTPDSSARRWQVVDPAGVWLGPVILPAAFTPTEIGADYVVGWFVDSSRRASEVHGYSIRR
jgi:hypothetical protein